MGGPREWMEEVPGNDPRAFLAAYFWLAHTRVCPLGALVLKQLGVGARPGQGCAVMGSVAWPQSPGLHLLPDLGRPPCSCLVFTPPKLPPTQGGCPSSSSHPLPKCPAEYPGICGLRMGSVSLRWERQG
jgi:hypothetical protein